MQFFKTPHINFVGQTNKAFIFSGILILITFISLIIHRGPNYSIDFVGGTMIQLSFEKPVVQDLAKVRTIITDLNFGAPEVKTIGGKDDNEIQIIVEKQAAEGTTVGDAIKAAFKEKYAENPFELRKEEKVGPKIGKELTRNTLLAILISLVALIIYIASRFHLPFGVGAIIALFHVVVITMGVFSVFDFEFSLPIVAAFLTIIGYSLNDTIVVFDRIRENMGTSSKKNFNEMVNDSINETLSRTIITGLTTLAVLIILFGFFLQSGDVIMLFAIALIVGIVIGTYSSVFIASPIVMLWNKKWPIKK